VHCCSNPTKAACNTVASNSGFLSMRLLRASTP